MPDSYVLQRKLLGMQSMVGNLQGLSNLFLPYDQPLQVPSGGRGGVQPWKLVFAMPAALY